MINFIMEASNREKVRASRFFTAGFHAHPVFGLARRTGVILHARRLLLSAYFAARLSLRRIVGAEADSISNATAQSLMMRFPLGV
jgi:hypothetical protein